MVSIFINLLLVFLPVFADCLFSVLSFVQILEDYIDKGGKFNKDTPNIAVISQLINKGRKSIDVSVTTTVDKIAINVSVNSTGRDSEASITVPNSILKANDTGNSTLIVVYYRTSKLFAPEFRRTEVCEDSLLVR